MRPTLAASAACAGLVACAAAPPPPPSGSAGPPRPQVAAPADVVATPGEARLLAQRLLAGLADRVTEARPLSTGPGFFLIGYELWERPAAAPFPNLCTARVHRVIIDDPGERARFDPSAPVAANARATSVGTALRFRAVGSVMAAQERPLAHEPACAASASGPGFFAAASDGDAYTALQTFEFAQRAAGDSNARAVTVDCTDLGSACPDGRRLLASLSTAQILSVDREACEGRDSCWRYGVQHVPREAPLSVLVQGPQRPMRVVITRPPVPVS